MKTNTDIEKIIKEFELLVLDIGMKQKPFVKNYPLGQLEKRSGDFIRKSLLKYGAVREKEAMEKIKNVLPNISCEKGKEHKWQTTSTDGGWITDCENCFIQKFYYNAIKKISDLLKINNPL